MANKKKEITLINRYLFFMELILSGSSKRIYILEKNAPFEFVNTIYNIVKVVKPRSRLMYDWSSC